MSTSNDCWEQRRVLPKCVVADLPQTYQLSSAELKFYEENGYLVISGLIDFTTLYTLKQHFVRICNGVENKGRSIIVREPSLVAQKLKPEDHINKISEILYDDTFFLYPTHARLLHVLSQLLGDDITAMNSMFINKPPGTPRHPPHQDLYYFPFRPADKIVGVWTAVDDVTTENGCLYVVPGSHAPPTIHVHGDIGVETKLYHGILAEDTVAPLDKRVNLEMKPGDTVFFHPCLVHGSRPNVSKAYRKAITIHFASSSCHYIDVVGSVQETVATEALVQMKKKGFHDITFSDLWKFKSRQVKGVRSNL